MLFSYYGLCCNKKQMRWLKPWQTQRIFKYRFDSFCEILLFPSGEFFAQIPSQSLGQEIAVAALIQVWASPCSPGHDVPEVQGNFPSVEKAGLCQYAIILGEELYMF